MKKITTVAALALAATALTGCAAAEPVAREVAQKVNPWQDDLRDEMLAAPEFTDSAALGEMCLGLTMFGIDSPAQLGMLALAFDESGDLPAPNVTMGEWADLMGEEVPLSLPADLTVREVATEVGAIMLDQCGIDY